MLYNDLADQIPEDYVFIDLQKITAEGVVLAKDLKEAGKAGPIVISIAESGGEILAAIAGVMRGSMSAIVFLIWIIFKIVCKTLWLGYTSKPTSVPLEEPVRSEVIQSVEVAAIPKPLTTESVTPLEDQPSSSLSFWATDEEEPELEPNVAFSKPVSLYVQAMDAPIEIESDSPSQEATTGQEKQADMPEPKKSENWLNKVTGGKL